MGQMRNATIAAWQELAGIQEATGDQDELLRQMSKQAYELIKVIELERSGIRDGDGCWGASDAMTYTAAEMAMLCDTWCYRYTGREKPFDSAVTKQGFENWKRSRAEEETEK
jgi:hypothetical protein